MSDIPFLLTVINIYGFMTDQNSLDDVSEALASTVRVSMKGISTN